MKSYGSTTTSRSQSEILVHFRKPQFAAAARPQTYRPSAAAVEFRATRDLRAYADGLSSRKVSLTGDESSGPAGHSEFTL